MPNTKDPQLPSLGDQAPSRDNAAPSAGPSREEEASTEGNAFHEDEASSAGVGEPGEAHSHAKDPKLPRQFSVYLVQLEQSFSGKDGVAKLSTADSRLVTFPDLQSCARARGVSIRNLTLSSLPHSPLNGHFCIKAHELTRVDRSTTLSSYLSLQPDSLAKDRAALSVYWMFPKHKDLNEVSDKIDTDTGKLSSNLDKYDKTAKKPGFEQGRASLHTPLPERIEVKAGSETKTSYEMDKEDWSRVLAGNELLHAFQFYPDQWKKLESTTLSALLEATQPGVSTNAIPHADETKTDQAKQAGQDKQEGQTSQGATTDQAGQAPQVPSTGGASPPAQPTAVPGATANVTSALAFDPLVPMPRSPTPLLVPLAAAIAKIDGSDAGHSRVSPPIWSNAVSVSTTRIVRVTSTTAFWSLNTGVSTKSMGTKFSFPIKALTFGIGLSKEESHSETHKDEGSTEESYMVAVHEVPVVQINVNETTVGLSEEAHRDIQHLRTERQFSDLLAFFQKYGTMVFLNTTIGGRLSSVRKTTATASKEETENEDEYKRGINASLGVPDKVSATGWYNVGEKSKTGHGNKEKQEYDSIAWSSVGGDPTLTVDPPAWRKSLASPQTWRPIAYDNPVRIDLLIGRLAGYSDVPALFATILACGDSDHTRVVFKPGPLLSSVTTLTPSLPHPGLALQPASGGICVLEMIKGSLTPTQPDREEIAPQAHMWLSITSDRDLRREIRANLYANSNCAINIDYVPPYLDYLRCSNNSFSVILRWTSNAYAECVSIPKELELKGDQMLLRTVTSRAWISAVWEFRKGTKQKESDFQDLREEAASYFAKSPMIEAGCDWIADSAKNSAHSCLVTFWLFGSDGTKDTEVELTGEQRRTAFHAFGIIDRQIRLGKFNMLPVSGELYSSPPAVPNTARDRGLAQLLEVEAMSRYLTAKDLAGGVPNFKEVCVDAIATKRDTLWQGGKLDDVQAMFAKLDAACT